MIDEVQSTVNWQAACDCAAHINCHRSGMTSLIKMNSRCAFHKQSSLDDEELFKALVKDHGGSSTPEEIAEYDLKNNLVVLR